MIVMTPATIQTTSSNPGLCTWWDISPETMKIAEPIIDPMTIMIASKRPRPLTRSAPSPVTPANVCACCAIVWF
jgi:hypothetical protein